MNANCIRPNNRPKTINNEKLLEAEIVYILSQVNKFKLNNLITQITRKNFS